MFCKNYREKCKNLFQSWNSELFALVTQYKMYKYFFAQFQIWTLLAYYTCLKNRTFRVCLEKIYMNKIYFRQLLNIFSILNKLTNMLYIRQKQKRRVFLFICGKNILRGGNSPLKMGVSNNDFIFSHTRELYFLIKLIKILL